MGSTQKERHSPQRSKERERELLDGLRRVRRLREEASAPTTERHSSTRPVLKMTRLAQRPKGATDDWLDDGARYDTALWQVMTQPSIVEWVGQSGIKWTVGVAIDRETLTPGVATLKAESAGRGPDLSIVADVAKSVGMFAVASASHIHFGKLVDPTPFPLFPLTKTCRDHGKEWTYYVAKIMAAGSEGIGAAVLERAGAPDYREVAVEYLAAVSAGEDPVDRIMLKLPCSSRATARKWIERSGKQGWLTTAPSVPGARRDTGPRFASE